MHVHRREWQKHNIQSFHLEAFFQLKKVKKQRLKEIKIK